MSERPSRRAVIGAVVALPAAALGLAACATRPPAPAVHRFRSVTIDAGPFADKGVPAYAARVADAARAAVAKAFAGRIDPGDRSAPALTIEIAGVSIPAWAGGGGGGDRKFGFGTDSPSDWMNGALVLRSPSGAVVDRRPHLSSKSPSGFWWDPNNEDSRMRDLAALYVWWAAKEYGD
jgi:hypothetical protein